MINKLKNFTESKSFQNVVIATIFLSSFMIGLENYAKINPYYELAFNVIDRIILFIFSTEILLRIAVFGRRPWQFFYSVWNVFDFVIVAVFFLPSQEFFAILRFARVLRIFRLTIKIQQSEIHRLKYVELEKAHQELEDAHQQLRAMHEDLKEEKEESERLLLNVLPHLIADRLKDSNEKIIADSFENVTVIFADIVGFTELSSRNTPEKLVEMLDDIFSRFDNLAEKHDLEKIKTIGDAYMVVAGVPEKREDHMTAIIDMALEMLAEIEEVNHALGQNFQIRIGVHSGSAVAGVIGRKKFIYDIWGDTVNIASRMESHGVPGKIQVTEEIYDALKDDYIFDYRGLIPVKGKGDMKTYLLDATARSEKLTTDELFKILDS